MLATDAITIKTFGSIELFVKVFNGIAMIFSGGYFSTLLALFGLIGATVVIFRSLISPSLRTVVLYYLIPVLYFGFCFWPKTSVIIEDVMVSDGQVITNQMQGASKVDNVPTVLAKYASFISTLGYSITQAMERFFHTVDDETYTKTGHIFGAENLLETRFYNVNNDDVQNNVNSFVKSCMLYDLSKRRYSVQQLKEADHVLNFLENKTNRGLGFTYCPPGSDQKALQKCEYCRCDEGIKRIKADIGEIKSKYANLAFYDKLPLVYKTLTSASSPSNKDDLLTQQLAMNAFKKGVNGAQAFAKSRSYAQQRETYRAAGAMAGKAILAMRSVFEALLYVAFIFVIPVLMIPGGFRILKNWLEMTIWVQLWGPLYVIIHYFSTLTAQKKVIHLLGTSIKLNMVTSIGLSNIYEDISAYSGYLLLIVPFLAYALMKGGISGLNQIASSMLSPVMSAAGTAAAEQTMRNYSYDSATVHQRSLMNTSGWSQSLSPRFSAGATSYDGGDFSVTGGGGRSFLQERGSQFQNSMNLQKSFQSHIQDQWRQHQGVHDSKSKTYLENVGSLSTNTKSLTDSFSSGQSGSHSLSSSKQSSLKSAFNAMDSATTRYAHSQGISEDQAHRELVDMALGGGVKIAAAKYANSWDSSNRFVEDHNKAQSHEAAQSFAKSFDETRSYSEGDSFQQLSKEDQSLMKSWSESLQTTISSQESLQATYNEGEELSKLRSQSSNSNLTMNENMSQGFWEFLMENQHGESGAVDAVKDRASMHRLQGDFFESLKPQVLADLAENGGLLSSETLASKFANSTEQLAGLEQMDNIHQEGVSKKILPQEEKFADHSSDTYKTRVNEQLAKEDFDGNRGNISSKEAQLSQDFEQQVAEKKPYKISAQDTLKAVAEKASKTPSWLASKLSSPFGPFEDTEKTPVDHKASSSLRVDRTHYPIVTRMPKPNSQGPEVSWNTNNKKGE